MRHYPVRNGNNRHYAVGPNSTYDRVLIQLGEDISIEPYHCQVRVALTVEEADHIIELLQQARMKVVHEGQKQAAEGKEEVVVMPCLQGGDGQGQEAA